MISDHIHNRTVGAARVSSLSKRKVRRRLPRRLGMLHTYFKESLIGTFEMSNFDRTMVGLARYCPSCGCKIDLIWTQSCLLFSVHEKGVPRVPT